VAYQITFFYVVAPLPKGLWEQLGIGLL